MDGQCKPHPSGHSDLNPRRLSRRKTLKTHSVTKLCYELRAHDPVLTGPCNPLFARLRKVGGAGHSLRAAVEYVGVDHRRSHVAVAEQLLNRAEGLAPLQQMGGTTWPQASVVEALGIPEGVADGRYVDSGGQLGPADRLLGQGGIQVVTPLLPGLGITPAVVLGERPLPGATLIITRP
jgi:hypothetical protein